MLSQFLGPIRQIPQLKLAIKAILFSEYLRKRFIRKHNFHAVEENLNIPARLSKYLMFLFMSFKWAPVQRILFTIIFILWLFQYITLATVSLRLLYKDKTIEFSHRPACHYTDQVRMCEIIKYHMLLSVTSASTNR